jgi:CRISPR system Cascade subunit CasD
MSTLVLRLAAPMQAWGSASKFDRRLTEMEPTKSGVIGMLACAMGIRREDSLAAFDDVMFGVRVDQGGELGVDFQMAHEQKNSKNLASWVTHRYYLFDAVFLAGIEGDYDFLVKIERALHCPAFPIYLGRRSCPPAGQVSLGIRDKSLRDTLQEEAWIANEGYQKRMEKRGMTALEIVREAVSDEETAYSVRDVPVTFSQKRRMYSFRNVIREQVPLIDVCHGYEQNLVMNEESTKHNPMELLEGKDVSIKS